MAILKKPEAAPEPWRQFLGPLDVDISPLVQRANRDYLYWDRFKYLVPEGVSPEAAWATLKLARTMQMTYVPLFDKGDHAFGYSLPACVLEYLHIIDQDAGGSVVTDEPGLYAAEKRWYLMTSIREEAIASSQVEGAATTRLKAKEMLESGMKPKNRSEQMIYNNYLTISKIKQLITEPLSPAMLKDLQASITHDTLDDAGQAGRFRQERDEPIYVMDASGGILHVPPSPRRIEHYIEALCDFANREEKEFIHPVVKGIILHFWLAYVHPFNDGNGRSARAVFYWHMLRNRYWLFEYLSISRFILKTRTQYYRSFVYSEIDEGDLTYFVVFNLRAIMAALRELRSYLGQKRAEDAVASKRLAAYPQLNKRQRGVLLEAVKYPHTVFTLKGHMQSYNVVYETARTDLTELWKAGLLRKKQEGNAFRFMPAEDLKQRLG